jgi:hypothetical protein
MSDLVISVLMGRYRPTDLFVYPNILLRDRPEVFTFKSKKNLFIVESGSGGIMGHAHPLKEVSKSHISKKIKDAKIYFTMETEYLHSHSDDEKIYYIAKSDDEYAIFDYETRETVSRCDFEGGHWHSLKIRDVVVVNKKTK